MLRRTIIEVRINCTLRELYALIWNDFLLMSSMHLRNLICKRHRHRNHILQGMDYLPDERKEWKWRQIKKHEYRGKWYFDSKLSIPTNFLRVSAGRGTWHTIFYLTYRQFKIWENETKSKERYYFSTIRRC